jgi:hypothetical protein
MNVHSFIKAKNPLSRLKIKNHKKRFKRIIKPYLIIKKKKVNISRAAWCTSSWRFLGVRALNK